MFNCFLAFDRIEKSSSFEDYRNKYDKTAKEKDYLLVKNSTMAEMVLGNFVLSLFSPIMAPTIIIGIFYRILAFLTNR